MTNDAIPSLILTPAEIARWEGECGEIDRQIVRLGEKKEKIRAKLEAARLLAPGLFNVTLTPEPSEPRAIRKRGGIVTWPYIIEDMVRAAGDGIRQKELLEQIRTGPYGTRLRDSESGYYNGIQKALKREQLIKRGEWLFTPAQHDAYMEKLASGAVKDVADETDFGSPSAAAAVRFITESPGNKSVEVIHAIWGALPRGAPRPSKTSLYNTLARLVEQQRIRKDESGAFYPFNGNEAPTGQAGGASEAGEGDTSPDDNRRGFRLVR